MVRVEATCHSIISASLSFYSLLIKSAMNIEKLHTNDFTILGAASPNEQNQLDSQLKQLLRL